MNQMVSVKDACQILGVSASTFKRICEKHSIPLTRTPGGHRRIDREELDNVHGVIWSRSKKPHPITKFSPPNIVDDMVDQLLEGNIERVLSTVFARMDTVGELSNILESTLVAALWKVGELWRTRAIDVYQERIASNTACTLLDLISQRLPKIGGQSHMAIGGTFESNFDTIGSKIVSVVFRSMGVRTINLGCNLPAASIAKAANDLQASLVWICHTHVQNIDSVLANHLVLRQSLLVSIPVLIGGGGLSPAIRRSLCDCQYYETISMMAEEIKRTFSDS